MISGTFLYRGQNVYEMAFLRVIAKDVFTPPLRKRSVLIPTKSGEFDYGADYHDNRVLQLSCLVERPITQEQFDNIKYLLSKKGRLILWDQPDRYYNGYFYESAEVLDAWRKRAREFTLNFNCDPYLYALNPTVIETKNSEILFEGDHQYPGTQKVYTRITIRNKGGTISQGIKVTAFEKQ